jgi:hypothetical protein
MCDYHSRSHNPRSPILARAVGARLERFEQALSDVDLPDLITDKPSALVALESAGTLIAVIEMSLSSWLVAGIGSPRYRSSEIPQ